MHRFYQEQYQIDGGKQDRYTTGSDAVGLTQGTYDTQELPIYRYLHRKGAPKYVIADHFFQAAFGGSFLNHQWLIAARAPLDTEPAARRDGDSQLGARRATGWSTTYPLYTPTGPVVDGQLTQECATRCNDDTQRLRRLRGQHRPAGEPAATAPARSIPLIDDTKYPNIGDRLTDAGISWNWYSGGWDDAEAGTPGPLFQYHHQPFNYFADYAPGQPGRAHLKDETRFITAAKNGHLPTVSVRQAVRRGERAPGLRQRVQGQRPPGRPAQDDHRRDPQAKDTLVVVTYDEFGGQWDHVSPPGRGTEGHPRRLGPGHPDPGAGASAVAASAPASTTRSTTRPRSWPPSSTASGWRRCRAETRRARPRPRGGAGGRD